MAGASRGVAHDVMTCYFNPEWIGSRIKEPREVNSAWTLARQGGPPRNRSRKKQSVSPLKESNRHQVSIGRHRARTHLFGFCEQMDIVKHGRLLRIQYRLEA